VSRHLRGEDGFRAFVVARHPAFLRAAYLLTGDRGSAEDLVQSALAEAAYRWSRLAEEQPEAYVRRVMYTRFCSGLRRQRILSERPMAEPPETVSPDDTDTVDTRVSLDALLHRLAPRQRACLVLRFYEDRSEAETAAILGCSVGTVKSQTHDALVRLRRMAPSLADLLPDRGEHEVRDASEVAP
jgi:RNA polymerase sigma-70 factor (sigma-E family)